MSEEAFGGVLGVGLDTVDIERFRNVLRRHPSFLERYFAATEREECARRSDPVPGLAARFAAKEALMKALGVGLGAFAFGEVEVVRAESGAPALRLAGRAAKLAEAAGVRHLHVSLTHSGLVASAIVLAT